MAMLCYNLERSNTFTGYWTIHFGGCTACWYGIAGHPGSGWQRGSAIWGARSTDMGGVRAHWARPPGHCAICALAFLSATPLNMRDLSTPGRPGGAAGNPLNVGASGGSSIQLEKSIGGGPVEVLHIQTSLLQLY